MIFCIIDEVDNILIDEARTPCIISGEAMEASELCKYANYIIKQLKEEDYEKDEKIELQISLKMVWRTWKKFLEMKV